MRHGPRVTLGALFTTSLWLLLVWGLPSSALADARDSTALTQFEQGKASYDAGKFEDALILFQKSLSLLPSPNSRLYVARCHRALGRVATAYSQLKLASREAQDRLTATGEKRFTATRDAAAGEAEELEPRVPRLTLAVPSKTPPDFVAKLDGREMPRATWGALVEIDPGKHTLSARGARVKPFRRTFTVSEGERLRIEIELERVPTARIILDLESRPSGLAISIDDKAIDSSAFDSVHDLDVGKRRIVASAPGYFSFVWQKTLFDNDEVRLKIDLRPSPRGGGAARGTPPWLFYSAAGATVVALGVGTIFAVGAKSTADEEQAKDPLLRDPAARDSVHDKSVVANALFATGAILAAGTGVLFFTTNWGPAERHEKASRRRVWAGVGAKGIAIGGAY